MSTPRRITLTMAERLAAMSPADKMLLDPAPLPQAVIPLTSWLIGTATPDQRWAKLLSAQPTAERVELRLGGKRTVPAATIPNLNPTAARKLAKTIGSDWVWLSSKARQATMYFSGSGSQFNVGKADTLAAQHGETLEKALLKAGLDVDVPEWKNVDRPGWYVSKLGPKCHCGSSIMLVDWWHAEALRRTNTHLIACPSHGLVGHEERVRWQNLVRLRREFDASIALQGSSSAVYRVYVVEVLDLPPNAKPPVYVGMTGRLIQERLAEHATENHPRQGRVFRKARGGRAGQLLPLCHLITEHMSDLRDLHSQLAARTAEAWLAEVLRLRGFDVHGGH